MEVLWNLYSSSLFLSLLALILLVSPSSEFSFCLSSFSSQSLMYEIFSFLCTYPLESYWIFVNGFFEFPEYPKKFLLIVPYQIVADIFWPPELPPSYTKYSGVLYCFLIVTFSVFSNICGAHLLEEICSNGVKQSSYTLLRVHRPEVKIAL